MTMGSSEDRDATDNLQRWSACCGIIITRHASRDGPDSSLGAGLGGGGVSNTTVTWWIGIGMRTKKKEVTPRRKGNVFQKADMFPLETTGPLYGQIRGQITYQDKT